MLTPLLSTRRDGVVVITFPNSPVENDLVVGVTPRGVVSTDRPFFAHDPTAAVEVGTDILGWGADSVRQFVERVCPPVPRPRRRRGVSAPPVQNDRVPLRMAWESVVQAVTPLVDQKAVAASQKLGLKGGWYGLTARRNDVLDIVEQAPGLASLLSAPGLEACLDDTTGGIQRGLRLNELAARLVKALGVAIEGERMESGLLAWLRADGVSLWSPLMSVPHRVAATQAVAAIGKGWTADYSRALAGADDKVRLLAQALAATIGGEDGGHVMRCIARDPDAALRNLRNFVGRTDRETVTDTDVLAAVPAIAEAAKTVPQELRRLAGPARIFELPRAQAFAIAAQKRAARLKELETSNCSHFPVPALTYVAGNGWTATWLATERELAEEGESMAHCVGDGDYGDKAEDCDVLIFSVRDIKGNRLATAEVFPDGSTGMINGYDNQPPKPKGLREDVLSAFRMALKSVGRTSFFDP